MGQTRRPATVKRSVMALTMIAQAVYAGFRIGEVSCPTRYFDDASSISFRRSITYGLGVISTSLKFARQRLGMANFRLFGSRRERGG